MNDKKDLSERDICTKYITPALKKAGWDIQSQIREEVSFTDGRITDIEMSKDNFKMNCIPEYMINGEIPDFEVFLKDRQRLMAKKLKEYYEKL